MYSNLSVASIISLQSISKSFNNNLLLKLRDNPLLSTLLLIFNRAHTLTLIHILLFSLISILVILVAYLGALPYTLIIFSAPTIYHQTACAVLYLSHLFYLILVVSILFYLLPNIAMFTSSNLTSTSNHFSSLSAFEIAKFICTFPLIALVYHAT